MPHPNDNGYDRIADHWNAARTDFRPGEESWFQAFAQRLPRHAKLLDLGCGAGHPNTSYLTQAGFKVHGVDGSKSLLDLARAQVEDATFELADLRTYVVPTGFDGVIAWDSLFHLPRQDQSAIFARIAHTLPSGAPFLFTSGGSEQEPFSDTMWDVAFDYDAHPPDLLPGELEKAGFELTRCSLLEKPAGGRNKGRLAVLAQRS